MGFSEYTTKNIKEVLNILNTDESGLIVAVIIAFLIGEKIDGLMFIYRPGL